MQFSIASAAAEIQMQSWFDREMGWSQASHTGSAGELKIENNLNQNPVYDCTICKWIYEQHAHKFAL